MASGWAWTRVASLFRRELPVGQHGGDVQFCRDVQRPRLPVGRTDLHEPKRGRHDLVGEVLQPGAELGQFGETTHSAGVLLQCHGWSFQ